MTRPDPSQSRTGDVDPRRAPTIGVVGFVLSVIGLVVPVLGVPGLVLAGLGLRKARRLGLPRRLCLAGVIIGVAACVVTLAMLFEWVVTAPR